MTFPKIALLLLTAIFSASSATAEDKPVKFGDVTFFPRWAQNHQHEFTPKGQEDLDHWQDMVTLLYLTQVQDGDGLAGTANAVLETYKKGGASIVKTGSVPKTEKKEAEHLIIAFFKRPELVESVFARFLIVDKTALVVIYSHREYGEDAGNLTNEWRKPNGVPIENLLMNLKDIPLSAETEK